MADSDGSGSVQLDEAVDAIKKWAEGEKIKLTAAEISSLTGLYEDAAGPDGALS